MAVPGAALKFATGAAGLQQLFSQQAAMLQQQLALLQALGVHEMDKVVGLRPGELLHCTYAQEAPGGCGTSRHCSKCGAVLAILASQKSGQPAEGECSLSMLEDGRLQSREFYVRCTPLELAGQSVTAMVLQDITAAKHREVLERLFLHDRHL